MTIIVKTENTQGHPHFQVVGEGSPLFKVQEVEEYIISKLTAEAGEAAEAGAIAEKASLLVQQLLHSGTVRF